MFCQPLDTLYKLPELQGLTEPSEDLCNLAQYGLLHIGIYCP